MSAYINRIHLSVPHMCTRIKTIGTKVNILSAFRAMFVAACDGNGLLG